VGVLSSAAPLMLCDWGSARRSMILPTRSTTSKTRASERASRRAAVGLDWGEAGEKVSHRSRAEADVSSERHETGVAQPWPARMPEREP